jgi:hypothetical protein
MNIVKIITGLFAFLCFPVLSQKIDLSMMMDDDQRWFWVAPGFHEPGIYSYRCLQSDGNPGETFVSYRSVGREAYLRNEIKQAGKIVAVDLYTDVSINHTRNLMPIHFVRGEKRCGIQAAHVNAIKIKEKEDAEARNKTWFEKYK